MEKPYRKLYRVRKGKVLLGLMSGLGAHFGIDPLILRLAAIALLFLSSAGLAVVVLYFVFALCVPYGGEIS